MDDRCAFFPFALGLVANIVMQSACKCHYHRKHMIGNDVAVYPADIGHYQIAFPQFWEVISIQPGARRLHPPQFFSFFQNLRRHTSKIRICITNCRQYVLFGLCHHCFHTQIADLLHIFIFQRPLQNHFYCHLDLLLCLPGHTAILLHFRLQQLTHLPKCVFLRFCLIRCFLRVITQIIKFQRFKRAVVQ